MRALRLSKTWLMLSLLALLGVLCAPVLALHCCCFSSQSAPHSSSATLPKSCHGAASQRGASQNTDSQVAPSQVTPSQSATSPVNSSAQKTVPSCHRQVKDQRSVEEPATASSQALAQRPQESLATQEQMSALADRCQCESLAPLPAALNPTPKLSGSFFHVALALPDTATPQLVSPVVASLWSVGASHAPRSPFLASLPGRSPPTL